MQTGMLGYDCHHEPGTSRGGSGGPPALGPWDLQQLSTGSEFHDETNGVGMIRNLPGVPGGNPKIFQYRMQKTLISGLNYPSKVDLEKKKCLKNAKTWGNRGNWSII